MASAFAGISIDSSRIIFQSSDDARGRSVGVTSSVSSVAPYLVRAQVSRDIEGNNVQTPFITTPSLFRLEPGSTNQVLVVKKPGADGLATDRESLFYFRSVAMPAGEKQSASPSSVVGGSLQVSTATVVKLFYRPGGLALPQQQAMGMLQFSSTGQGLRVTNPTPYYITLADLKVAGVRVPLSAVAGNTMIAPLGLSYMRVRRIRGGLNGRLSMIMAVRRCFMVRSAKPLSGVALACVLVSSGIQAADTAEVNFTAQISDGTCDVQLSQSSLQFGIHKAVDFQSGATVAMLPLTATVICSGATTPKMSVSGSTPYSDSTIFRDPGSVATGVGFMVRQDTGDIDLGSFYNPSQAVSNNVSFALSPVGNAGTPHNEPFLLGLVRAGIESVTPGAVKSTLTFTVSFD